MAEPEEHLTMLGAGLCQHNLNPPAVLGCLWASNGPKAARRLQPPPLWGGCFTLWVPEAPAQCCLSTPHPGLHPPRSPQPSAACRTLTFQLCHHDLAAAFSTWLRPPGTSWQTPGCQPEQGRQGPAAGRISQFLPMLHCCSQPERLWKRCHSPLLGWKVHFPAIISSLLQKNNRRWHQEATTPTDCCGLYLCFLADSSTIPKHSPKGRGQLQSPAAMNPGLPTSLNHVQPN